MKSLYAGLCLLITFICIATANVIPDRDDWDGSIPKDISVVGLKNDTGINY